MPGTTSLHPQSAWTEERINTLIILHNQGQSAAQIGASLGLTRNAVLGKLHRLRLSGNTALQAQKPAPPKAKKYESFFGWKKGPKPEPKPKPAPKKQPVYPAPKPTSETNVLLENRTSEQCRFIEADFPYSEGAQQYMCGAKVWERGQSYCRYHYKQCLIVSPPSEVSKLQRHLLRSLRRHYT